MDKRDQASSSRIETLEKTCSTYATEISRLEFKVGELQAEVSRLHAELNRRRGTRQLAHDLYRAVDDGIIARIDRRGYARKLPEPKATYAIKPTLLASNNKAELMAAAQAYDIQTYFRLKPLKTGMKLHYRVVSKAYRTARNAGVYGLKQTYRVAKRVVK